MYSVNVDEEKCVGCGECADVCPVEVFELKDEKSVPVNENLFEANCRDFPLNNQHD